MLSPLPILNAGTGDGSAPGKLRPDRKVWVNASISSLAFTAFSYLHAYTGIDVNVLNPPLNFILDALASGNAPDMDVTMLFSILIGSAAAQYIPPSLHDTVAWLTEAAVRAANASPHSPVKAVIVDKGTSDRVAELDIKSGDIPADIIEARKAAHAEGQ